MEAGVRGEGTAARRREHVPPGTRGEVRRRVHRLSPPQRSPAWSARGHRPCDRVRHRRQLSVVGRRRRPGLREADPAHRPRTPPAQRHVHRKPVRAPHVLPVRARRPRLRRLAGAGRERHGNDLGAHRADRGVPTDAPLADEHADIERVVAFWGGSSAVRQRLHALAQASASVVLFLEYIPQNLQDWLAKQLAAGQEAVTAVCAMVQRRLRTDIAFMNTNGLLHFDAHFRNILTDGRRLYLGDLGLATSPRFDLSPDERDFLARNASHDASYAVTQLVNWLVTNIAGVAVPDTGGPVDRNEYIRRCATGVQPAGVAAPASALISRYAPVATVMNDFYWNLFGESRATAYPADEIAQALLSAHLT